MFHINSNIWRYNTQPCNSRGLDLEPWKLINWWLNTLKVWRYLRSPVAHNFKPITADLNDYRVYAIKCNNAAWRLFNGLYVPKHILNWMSINGDLLIAHVTAISFLNNHRRASKLMAKPTNWPKLWPRELR